MDWSTGLGLFCLLLLLTLTQAWSLPAAAAWSPVAASKTAPVARQLNDISPYLDLALCPIRGEPWSCARQKSARILDVWDGELSLQWQKLKVEADRQLNATIERRGYSASELPIKEKPSTLLKKIEIGTNYMKEYLAETMDGFLGREYEYQQTTKAAVDSENVDDDDEEADDEEQEEEDDAEEEEDAGADNQTGEEEEEEEEDDDEEETDTDAEPEIESAPAVSQQFANDVKSSVFSGDSASSGVEFIELQDSEGSAAGAVKKPGGGKRKKKGGKRKQKKKKGQQQHEPATLVVVQQAAPELHEVDSGHESGSSVVSHGHGGGEHKPFKRKNKRGKRKRKGQHQAVVEHESSDHLGLGLLDDLIDVDTDALLGGGKRKHKFSTNYVTRGKKKKKKKALAKLVLLGSFLKAKIELLLKILGAHLQIKFFAIALIGLLINIARFWIDVKRGGAPSKVVYVEHAHHQHHYEDHGEDWGEQGGSYWKRSLQTDPSIEDTDSATDSYQVRTQQQPQDAHHLAYRNQHQWQ
ncbi:neurofilament medium polypeptide isoform X2 [Drosophila busckii]|uniref:neurofilament medium polypeptide isoform X2 n=1 Tax=Drosophila busckii TaxID=30019 RepID=UPI00083EEBC8|nr:neurofilament medium polypeptide isoform X2 [Drosophila busckii]